MKTTRKDVQRPCIGCKYFKVCGSTNRKERCEGRDINRSK